VLFPGDPARVDRFASFLEGFRVLGQNREFRIGVGHYRGLELGICSTGIGGPSTEIALVEAAELGCKFALRVGGTGVLDPNIPLGALLVVEEAARGGGAASHYAPRDMPARPSPLLFQALQQAAEASGGRWPTRWSTIKVASTDGYYAAQGRTYPHAEPETIATLDNYRRAGISALDMETETVFVAGAALGLQCGALLTVHANRANDTWLEEYEPAQDRMIGVACEALRRIAF
jgi:uridine phosphorylase